MRDPADPTPDQRALADAMVRRIRDDPVLTGSRFLARAGEPETIFPGVMYRYPEVTADKKSRVELTVFLGVGTLGAALWQQEVSALERVSGLASGSLPELLDSGYLPADGDAGATYVRTRAADPIIDANGDSTEASEQLHERRGEALRHLWLLADALDVIHDCRIVHRNLWPQAIQVELTGDAAQSDDPETQFAGMRLQLSRFEMSGMVSNMLRVWKAGRAGPDDVRDFMLAQPARSRVFAAPERLRFMFGSERLGAQDFSGDVFGLGMIAVEWLLGPATLGSAEDWGDLESIEALQRRIRSAVTTSDLPVELRQLLADMISERAPRPTARDVVTDLGRLYGASLLEFNTESEPLAPYLIAFMPGPGRADKTLYKWGYLSQSSGEPEGAEELAHLLQEDIRGGRVLYSPDGAAPYVFDGEPEDARQATTVIEGREFVWFLMRMFKPYGIRQKREYDEIQIVRYVVERSRATYALREFLRGTLSRVLHDVEAINFDDDRTVHDARVEGHPSWQPVLKSLRVRKVAPDGVVDRQRAMEWYVEYQNAVLRGREYAYQVVDSSVPGRPQIAADEEAEQERTLGVTDPLARYVLSDPDRPSLRDFIVRAQELGGDLELQLSALGSRLNSGARAKVDSIRDRNLVLEAQRGIPPRGWLRLADDEASSAQIRNQNEAVAELSRRRDLLAQLAAPHSVPRSRFRWGPEVSGGLIGEGAAVVREMLAHESLFVLQGPPGTGKTTITSHAIAAYLKREHGARILVSAQSHDALDNLAERILELLQLDSNASNGLHTALRIANTARHASVSLRMQHFLEAGATEELITSIRASARRALPGAHRTSRELGAVIEDWIGLVDRLGLDLRLRLRRGANLVFATTGASTNQNLVTRGSREPFDWVVIEEAARAWPSELALPMTRGTRWTLIGDQAQIGAYGRADIERLIERFQHDDDPELQALWAQKDVLASGFDLFAGFFAGVEEASWRHTLQQQHRMDERVAEIVSKTFYKRTGGLTSPGGRRPHGLEHPEWLSGEAIVWIDTGSRKRAIPSWSNEEEARDVAGIVRRIAPELERSRKTLAVLTPYREQVGILGRAMGERTRQISTIDGFQGREADVIVASLVRDQVVDKQKHWANAGHLTDPGRANVLMSRARSLLILVGDLELFERSAGEHWAEMVATVRQHGRVIGLDEAALT